MNPSNSADQKNNPSRANETGVFVQKTYEVIMSHIESEAMQSTQSIDQSAQPIAPASALTAEHRQHLLNEGFTEAHIEQMIAMGVRSIDLVTANSMGFRMKDASGTYRSSGGLYFPFTKEFGQIRADAPLMNAQGKPAKYLTPIGAKSKAMLPDGCKVITEGWKDATAGSLHGSIPTGALAGVSHYRKAVAPGSGFTVLFDADGWTNPGVFTNLFNAGLYLKGRIQLVPEIADQPKAGLCEYFKSGATTDDYRSLIESAMKPDAFLMALPDHWKGLEPLHLSKCVEALLRLAVERFSELDLSLLLEKIRSATGLAKRDLMLATNKASRAKKKREWRELREQVKQASENGEQIPESLMCILGRNIKAVQKNWGDRLRFNKLTKRIEFDGEPIEIDRIYLKMATALNIDVRKSEAIDIVMDLAMQNAYHPVEIYLREVHEQYRPDTSILENVADRYFGTNNPLYNSYVKRMMIGAVARVMQPGCKLDTALILQGNQGIGKSSFFKALAGEQWFDDSLGNVSDKDERLKLDSSWICEWAELDSIFKRKDISAAKAFLSTSVDNLRVPYGRSVEAFPRHSIIVGTANPSELLSDPTGSRRFWVIPVQRRIDLKRLEAERDRLWSAAVELYQRGEQWHLTELEAAASEKANQDFEMIDSWETYIRNYLAGKDWVTTSEILQHALQIEIGRHDRASQMRAADILKRLGWEPKTKTIGGDRVRCWALTQPTQPQNEVVPRLCHPETVEQQASQPSTQPATTFSENFSNSAQQSAHTQAVEQSETATPQENKKFAKRLCQVVQVVTPQTQSGFQGDTTSDTTSEGCSSAAVEEFLSQLPRCQRYEEVETLKERFSPSVVKAAWLQVKGTAEGDRIKALKRSAGKAKPSKSQEPIA